MQNISQADRSPDACVGYPYGSAPNVLCRLVERKPIFTNLRMRAGEGHEALKSVLFWAIYIETSHDTFFSGNDNSILNTYDARSAQLSAFLKSDAFCTIDHNGIRVNPRDDEPPKNSTGWNAHVVRLEHCEDIRYLMAQTFINGFLRYERYPGITYDPSDSEQLMGIVYGFLYENFATAVGKGASTFRFWTPVDGDYRGKGCNGITQSYSETIFDINRGKSYRYEAVKWLRNYTECLLREQPNTRAAQSYVLSIGAQIDRAIEDLYFERLDPTYTEGYPIVEGRQSSGAFTILDLNFHGKSVKTPIGELEAVGWQPLWNDESWRGETLEQVVREYYARHISTIKPYIPNEKTVVVPSLVLMPARGDGKIRLERMQPNLPGYFIWISKVLQAPADSSFVMERYTIDICNDPQVLTYISQSDCLAARAR